MSYKVKIRWLIIAAVVVFIISTVLYYTGNQFDDSGNFVGNPYVDFQQFLDFFSVLSFIFLVILYFLPALVFTAWFKFARIYVPAALVFSVGGGAKGSDLFNTDAEFFTTFFSFIFVVVSIVLIVRAQRRVKREQPRGSNPFPMGGQKPS